MAQGRALHGVPGDFTTTEWEALIDHYGESEHPGGHFEGEFYDTTGVALEPDVIRHLASLRQRYPRYFKPPKGKVWRGATMSWRQLKRVLGQAPGKRGTAKVRAKIPLRLHRSWTMRKRSAEQFRQMGAARHQSKRLQEEGTVNVPGRYAVLLETTDSSQFVLNPNGIYKLTGSPRVKTEQELVPAGPISITRIDWYSLGR